jgi:hypothetical protein
MEISVERETILNEKTQLLKVCVKLSILFIHIIIVMRNKFVGIIMLHLLMYSFYQ